MRFEGGKEHSYQAKVMEHQHHLCRADQRGKVRDIYTCNPRSRDVISLTENEVALSWEKGKAIVSVGSARDLALEYVGKVQKPRDQHLAKKAVLQISLDILLEM